MIMNVPSQLQFKLLPPEAQRAALQRLALRGCDPMSISVQTGVPEVEVRRQLGEAIQIRIDRGGRRLGR
jgi:hypothetical protein